MCHIKFSGVHILVMFAHAVSSYDSGDQFNMSSLSKLEEANIPIVTALKSVDTLKQLVSAARITLTEEDKEKLDENFCEDDIDIVIERWLTGASLLPPTWRSLHDVLRQINMAELSQQIVEFLSGENVLYTGWATVRVSAGLVQLMPLNCQSCHIY